MLRLLLVLLPVAVLGVWEACPINSYRASEGAASCLACVCYGHGSATLYAASGVVQMCNPRGGQCNCDPASNTTGPHCASCRPGFFRRLQGAYVFSADDRCTSCSYESPQACAVSTLSDGCAPCNCLYGLSGNTSDCDGDSGRCAGCSGVGCSDPGAGNLFWIALVVSLLYIIKFSLWLFIRHRIASARGEGFAQRSYKVDNNPGLDGIAPVARTTKPKTSSSIASFGSRGSGDASRSKKSKGKGSDTLSESSYDYDAFPMMTVAPIPSNSGRVSSTRDAQARREAEEEDLRVKSVAQARLEREKLDARIQRSPMGSMLGGRSVQAPVESIVMSPFDGDSDDVGEDEHGDKPKVRINPFRKTPADRNSFVVTCADSFDPSDAKEVAATVATKETADDDIDGGVDGALENNNNVDELGEYLEMEPAAQADEYVQMTPYGDKNEKDDGESAMLQGTPTGSEHDEGPPQMEEEEEEEHEEEKEEEEKKADEKVALSFANAPLSDKEEEKEEEHPANTLSFVNAPLSDKEEEKEEERPANTLSFVNAPLSDKEEEKEEEEEPFSFVRHSFIEGDTLTSGDGEDQRPTEATASVTATTATSLPNTYSFKFDSDDDVGLADNEGDFVDMDSVQFVAAQKAASAAQELSASKGESEEEEKADEEEKPKKSLYSSVDFSVDVRPSSSTSLPRVPPTTEKADDDLEEAAQDSNSSPPAAYTSPIASPPRARVSMVTSDAVMFDDDIPEGDGWVSDSKDDDGVAESPPPSAPGVLRSAMKKKKKMPSLLRKVSFNGDVVAVAGVPFPNEIISDGEDENPFGF